MPGPDLDDHSKTKKTSGLNQSHDHWAHGDYEGLERTSKSKGKKKERKGNEKLKKRRIKRIETY